LIKGQKLRKLSTTGGRATWEKERTPWGAEEASSPIQLKMVGEWRKTFFDSNKDRLLNNIPREEKKGLGRNCKKEASHGQGLVHRKKFAERRGFSCGERGRTYMGKSLRLSTWLGG